MRKKNGKAGVKPAEASKRLGYKVETLPSSELKPHPQNYRTHPADQLEHIGASLKQHGFYRNVVIARDNTILAGHGVVQAAEKVGIFSIPTLRLDLDPTDPRALKVLAGDNELGKFAENDDRMLTELLRGIREEDDIGLLGTGYDDKMLAALVMVSRHSDEIQNINEAAEWVGMPEYGEVGPQHRLIIEFNNEADRDTFIKKSKITLSKKSGFTWSAQWPEVDRMDASSIRFEG